MRRHYKISVKYFIDKQNDTNDKPIDTDSHWLSDPTLTRIQEIIFDLYDEKKYQQARKLESVEEMIIKEMYKKYWPIVWLWYLYSVVNFLWKDNSMTVKIISDELITQINDQLKSEVEKIVDRAISNIDWSTEIDMYGRVQDELSQMDILDYMDTSNLEDKIGDQLESMLSELTIQRGA